MKTAISIPDEIFREAERTAKKFKYTRSELFTIAVKEFLEKIRSKRLLNALNEVYSEEETTDEIFLRQKGKKYYSHKILKERF